MDVQTRERERHECVWSPLPMGYLIRRLGWRDRRVWLLFVAWIVFTLVCLESSRWAVKSQAVFFNFPILGGTVFLTILPSVYLCQLALFLLGFQWAVIPSFLSIFLLCLDYGYSLSWSALIGLGDPLGLAILALIFRTAAAPIDCASVRSVAFMVAATLAGCVAGASGAFVWSEASHLNSIRTVAAWEGWILGTALCMFAFTMPILRLSIRGWQRFLFGVFPQPPRPKASFLFVAASISAVGLALAGFLAGTSHLAAARLLETLREGVKPEVSAALWNAVASWQLSAWSAILVVMAATLGGLGAAYYWAQHWRRQHADLIEARQRAEAALEVKSRFLATMSHELRTPMHGILGMNELLQSTDLSAEQREYADIVNQSARCLLTLLDDLLHLSKIEAGKLTLLDIPFSPVEQVRQVVQLFEPRARLKDVEMRLHLDSNLPPMVLGDPDRFRQILMNLVGNAIKFTDSGFIRASAGLAGDAPGSALCITVEDTGPGIAADIIPRLFQPFSQGDTSMTRKHGGTGLGLSISKKLAEAMGGSITLDSVVGQGSTFRLTIPLRPSPGLRPDRELLAVGDQVS